MNNRDQYQRGTEEKIGRQGGHFKKLKYQPRGKKRYGIQEGKAGWYYQKEIDFRK